MTMMPSIGDLPPMPDRHTGEPRPPRAPVDIPKQHTPPPWNPRKVPRPPENEGAVLEWDYGDRRTQLITFAITALIVMAFDTWRNSGFNWVTDFGAWVAIVVISFLMSLVARTMRCSAGADWLMERKAFVKTYELTSVEISSDWHKGLLRLRDRSGRGLRIGLGEVMVNQQLWDLVYNGIRHSVANGAHVGPDTARRLYLNDVVAMREHKQRQRDFDPEK